MTVAEKKHILNQYIWMKRQAHSIEQEIASLTDIKSPRLDGMPRGNGRSDIADAVIRKMELIDKWNRRLASLEAAQTLILNGIDNIEHGNEKAVLIKKYIQGERFEKIAADMNYSFRQILRIHGQALKDFEIK